MLVRRVADETAAVVAALSAQGRAGDHLGLAWRAAFRRHPDPSTSYRESIRAVEVAAIPVVSPNNTKATLGTVIADIRNDPTKWVVDLHGSSATEQVEAVRGMLELLWKGQSDRHGTPDPNAPLSVSQEQAEAAIHLAIALVRWFGGGVVRVK